MSWQELKRTRVCVIMDECTSYAGGEKFVNSNDSPEMMLQSMCVFKMGRSHGKQRMSLMQESIGSEVWLRK